MKTDQLEKFILAHRDEFDVMEPDANTWSKISLQDVSKPKSALNWKTILGRVAAVLVIFVSSYYFHRYVDYQRERSMIQPNVTALEDRQILNEMLESKAYYTRLIDSKTEQVFLLTANQPSLRTEIQEEMKQLDQEFLELQNDLYDLTDSEEVLAAMIQNYRLKLQILEETMLQLKAQSKEKNQDHETNRISI
ncbi:MAG: hypothetical protein KKF98_01620 [Bacteroidetes bacterium]|nr:hypothetical protein [Bacteroidota bacterium]